MGGRERPKMNKFLKITAVSLAVIALSACGGGDKDGGESGKASTKAPAATSSSAGKYSKADFMKACTTSMTEAQCNCYVDFYKSIGLQVTDLGDSDKVQAAMKGLKPEQAMKVAKCVQ